MADEGLDAQEPMQVDAGYVLVMDDRSETWQWPTAPDDPESYYITAKHPGVDEDKVRSALSPAFDMNAKKMTGNIRIAPASEAGFVEKCVRQITAYRIPASKEGKRYVAERKDANGGDNYENRAIFTSFLRVPQLRKEIEAFLDRVAGRAQFALADFAALGEEQGE